MAGLIFRLDEATDPLGCTPTLTFEIKEQRLSITCKARNSLDPSLPLNFDDSLYFSANIVFIYQGERFSVYISSYDHPALTVENGSRTIRVYLRGENYIRDAEVAWAEVRTIGTLGTGGREPKFSMKDIKAVTLIGIKAWAENGYYSKGEAKLVLGEIEESYWKDFPRLDSDPTCYVI